MNIFLDSNVKMTRNIEVNKNDAYRSKWQKLAASLLLTMKIILSFFKRTFISTSFEKQKNLTL